MSTKEEIKRWADIFHQTSCDIINEHLKETGCKFTYKPDCEHEFHQVGCGGASYASCVRCGKIERLVEGL